MSDKFEIYRNEKEYVKTLINVLNQGQKFLKPLNTKYWVAQWSWQPICDGIYPSETTITGYYILPSGDFVYFSKFNNRRYFGFQLCETKEECEKVCDILNSFGYESDIAICDMTKDEQYDRLHRGV